MRICSNVSSVGLPRIHDPDSVRTSILCFDLFEKVSQGGLVTGGARHHLIGKRKALWGHHQGDDHLDAVRALVSAVAELALVLKRRITLKRSAGQIVEQDIKARLEQYLPALTKKREEGALVGQQFVQAPVRGVIGQHPSRTGQQILHGAVFIPVAMQPPLTTGVNELITHLCFQHLQPLRALPTHRQTLLPESVEFQLLPQLERQPARSPGHPGRGVMATPAGCRAAHPRRPRVVRRGFGDNGSQVYTLK